MIKGVLALVFWGFSFAAWSAPLAFVAQRSGSFTGVGVQAYMTAIASARLTRPGVDDIVVSRGVFPPTPATNIPLRLLAPQSDFTVTDVTMAAIGPNPPARTHPREIIFGDINGDGLLDIFVAAHGYDQAPFSGETNALLLSQPGGSYNDASALLPTAPDFSHSAVTGDINGDSKSDICVMNIYGVVPYCLLGNGGTAFVQGGHLPSYVTSLAQKYTTSLMLDVDGDGHPDLILGADASSQSVVLFNDGTGDFTQRNPWTFPSGLFGGTSINLSIAVIDINGDGFPDLLFSQTSLNYVGHAIQVFINDHHGAFLDQTATYLPGAMDSTGAWLQFIRVLDLNGDGIPDIYAQGVSGIAPTSNPIVFAWVSDRPGHYVAVDSSVIGGHFPFMVVFADVDGDGLPDLISLANGPLGQTNYQTFRNVTPVSNRSNRHRDFNHDGKDDLLWTNSATGEKLMWLMNGGTIIGGGTLLTDPNWSTTQTGDFNGNGKTDLLWRNSVTGETVIWLMDGAAIVGSASLLTSTAWSVIKAGDFNGDGKMDLLWRNSVTGEVVIWLMNGTTIIGGRTLLTDLNWVPTHVADFNGDGQEDILWRNTASGQTVIWLMHGVFFVSGGAIMTDPSWTVTHVADFNADGKADIVWRNTSTGFTAVWLMNGTSLLGGGGLLSDPNWVVSGVDDLNGDGKADILWRNTASNTTAAWLMNGAILTSGAGLLGPNWQVTRTADVNGDGMADILWANTATGDKVLWIMNGTSPTAGYLLSSDPQWSILP